jgi:hypothetical protein
MPSTRSVRAANAALPLASAKAAAARMVFHVFMDLCSRHRNRADQSANFVASKSSLFSQVALEKESCANMPVTHGTL